MTIPQTVSVLFKRPGFVTSSYRKGDVVLLSEEDARRSIDAGDAIPCRPDIDEVNITRLLAGQPDQGG